MEPDEWRYDQETSQIVCIRPFPKPRRLIAHNVSPEHAQVILRLIGVAREVDRILIHEGCTGSCECVVCEARRCLKAIGGTS